MESQRSFGGGQPPSAPLPSLLELKTGSAGQRCVGHRLHMRAVCRYVWAGEQVEDGPSAAVSVDRSGAAERRSEGSTRETK